MDAYPTQDAAGAIKLDAMENPHRLPAQTRERLAGALAEAAVNRYPDASPASLAQLVRRRDGIGDGHRILFGNGSDEVIQMLLTACCVGGEEESCAMGFAPSFVMYEQLALIAGAEWVAVPLDGGYGIDMPAALDLIGRRRPRLLFVASPNNPSGNAFPAAELERLASAMQGSGWLVLDEAYRPYSDPDLHAEYWSRLSAFPNALFMRTFSKLGMAGIRLGYLVGPAGAVDEVDKVRLPYNVNVYTQMVALQLLEDPDTLGRLVQPVIRQREALAGKLDSLPGVRTLPSRGNFLLTEVPDAPERWRFLRERGVLVKLMKPAPSGHLGSHLRITVGAEKENAILVETLRESLGQATAGPASDAQGGNR